MPFRKKITYVVLLSILGFVSPQTHALVTPSGLEFSVSGEGCLAGDLEDVTTIFVKPTEGLSKDLAVLSSGATFAQDITIKANSITGACSSAWAYIKVSVGDDVESNVSMSIIDQGIPTDDALIDISGKTYTIRLSGQVTRSQGGEFTYSVPITIKTSLQPYN
ncbi:hypothetical protein [Thiolinea disciformis]|uniref:hypothetical protein n=1 Tax=Thiolinea disciformis TaxID=125614 RepID=UPI00037A8C38|nr:hypothetical protein [Thiolinea disciformis]